MKTNLILVLRILIAIAPLKKENVSKYVFFLVLMESTNWRVLCFLFERERVRKSAAWAYETCAWKRIENYMKLQLKFNG